MVASDKAENSQDHSINYVENESTTSTSIISETNVASGSGSSTYKANYYLKKIKEMCNCFDKVVTKAFRMEQNNNGPISESIQFADLISAVGHELVTCGKRLQDSSQQIHMARSSTATNQLSVQVTNSNEVVSAQQIQLNDTGNVFPVSETQQEYGPLKGALRK